MLNLYKVHDLYSNNVEDKNKGKKYYIEYQSMLLRLMDCTLYSICCTLNIDIELCVFMLLNISYLQLFTIICTFLIDIVYSLMHVCCVFGVNIDFDRCFSEAVESCIKINEKNPLLLPINECRSRHAKFIYYNNHLKYKLHTIQRDREPSRLPIRRLTRAFHKSRRVRRALRRKIDRKGIAV